MDAWEATPNILIVDDEPTLTRPLARMMDLMAYHAQVATSGEAALDLLEKESFDLVLLDLRMPGVDGLEVLDRAQTIAPATPFIILTAHGSLDSAITAMRQGAFDYLLKPCPIEDIVETVNRGLEKRRRTQQREQLVGLLKETLAEAQAEEKEPAQTPKQSPRLLTVGPITLDTQWRAAIVSGELVQLSNTEYEIMVHFAEHPDEAVSCRELVQQAQGLEMSEQEARPIIRMHIYRLRQKLEPEPDQPSLLRTVRGVGYMFVTDEI